MVALKFDFTSHCDFKYNLLFLPYRKFHPQILIWNLCTSVSQ